LLTPIPRNTGREIDHMSAFGMLEWKISDAWKFTVEGRYSDEKETIDGVNCSPANNLPLFPGGPIVTCMDPSLPGFQVFGPSINYLYAPTQQAPGVPVQLSSKHKFSSPRFTLEVKPTPDILAYASLAKAVKPGGISTVTAGSWQDADYDGNYDEFTFKNEHITNYELGMKSTFFNGRLRLNPSVFYIKYTDKQVGAQLISPSGIAVGRLLNAGSAEAKGLELDAQWRATDHWEFGVNYAYLDTQFTDFPFTSTSSSDAARFGSCPRGPNPRLCYINLKGKELERAPRHSVIGTARYTQPIGDVFGSAGVKFFIEGDVSAQSERYVDIFNRVKLNDFVQGNVRLGLTSDRWDVLLYVNNVTNDDTVLSANNSPGDVDEALFEATNFSPADDYTATLPDPRIVGIRFSYRFKGGK
jgi:outer membrane receptor protein involved in Fe transport